MTAWRRSCSPRLRSETCSSAFSFFQRGIKIVSLGNQTNKVVVACLQRAGDIRDFALHVRHFAGKRPVVAYGPGEVFSLRLNDGDSYP